MEDYIISPSVRGDMPKAIQKILEEQEKMKNEKQRPRMWTPAVEAEYQQQVDTLASKISYRVFCKDL